MPLDIAKVNKQLDSLTENMRKKREQVYPFVLGQRLNRRQANRVHTLQYQPREYVLVSKTNTKKEREKTRPMSTGPYIVKEIISDNVYEVESLLGKEKIYHAAYLWFYESTGYMPDEGVRHVFLQDTGELEVKRIVEWRMNEGDTSSM